MVESEAAGDFDYLYDDPADGRLIRHDQVLEPGGADESGDPQAGPDDDMWDEPDDSFWDNQPNPENNGRFDAFNTESWRFSPAPTPWYRTRAAATTIVAACAAVAAIVVSGVLLAFRGTGTITDVTSSVTPTAPTSAPTPVASSQPPPPASPPASSPPPTVLASPEVGAPRPTSTTDTHPSKGPEINVTRTPVTRLPLSVAPQQRVQHNVFH